MTARGDGYPVLDARAAEVERIAESPVLHGSESLRKLFRYLANRAIQEPGVPIREHEIAAEVFGRSSFDPRIDSAVRVNVTRLRAKLIEYQSGPGTDAPVSVELPKGSYTITFRTRPTNGVAPLLAPVEMEGPPAGTDQLRVQPVNRLVTIALMTMSAIAAMLAITVLLQRSGRNDGRTAVAAQENPAASRFWGMLLNSPSEPWVVFSNATFVGRPAAGMRYFVPSRDTGQEVLDFYTGVGEVLGVHALDRMFAQLNRSIRVKRGALLSLDDVENDDVVYVGSPLENLTLRDVPGLQDFEFKLNDTGPRRGEGMLVNRRPRAGEPAIFEPSSLPLTEDYAVVGLVPGLNPQRWALILAGTSTIGTQGAVEYVCREDTLHELLNRLGRQTAPETPPLFEAIINVQIKGGVPVHSRMVVFHRHRPPE
jgi:hypothetical protein